LPGADRRCMAAAGRRIPGPHPAGARSSRLAPPHWRRHRLGAARSGRSRAAGRYWNPGHRNSGHRSSDHIRDQTPGRCPASCPAPERPDGAEAGSAPCCCEPAAAHSAGRAAALVGAVGRLPRLLAGRQPTAPRPMPQCASFARLPARSHLSSPGQPGPKTLNEHRVSAWPQTQTHSNHLSPLLKADC